ncbi:MAG: pyrophosphokinase, partial [Dehalococcoidia bacterium]|nr:pyrophosphokinase [Dehalococcoidia bacterium]
MDINELLTRAREYLPAEKVGLIERAYQFAVSCHEGQWRKSGAPYLEHPLETAGVLVELQLDAATLAGALLHDVVEDCAIPLATLEAHFGAEVSRLVDGATKLTRISQRALESDAGERTPVPASAQAENLRKMLVAMAQDLRVVFIKLADRLHNMRTLEALSLDKRHSIARETLEIYAPLAHRLGIWQIKWQLEDLAFRFLEPRQYRQITKLVAIRRGPREDFIGEVVQTIRVELDKVELKAEVFGRAKHLYSIHQKMEKYAKQGKEFSDIHDLFAIRVVVDTVPDCYSALGVSHNLWHPIPDEFNDFIANPKGNGYRSLHTTVMYRGATPLEIQIRTREMHRIAEYGIAAHWRYKEGDKAGLRFEERISWMRQLVEWHGELSGSEEFLESVKTDIFIDQVFVFTPKGEIKPLPQGATPLDFAYRIHTDLGHRCIGAKVNGKLVSLNYQLRNGETVEIMTAKAAKGPSLDWLNSELGYVRTSHAREKVRQWFKKQERSVNIERGRALLEKEVKRLGLTEANYEELAKLFKYESLDDFLAALGYGAVTATQLAQRIGAQQEQPRLVSEITPGAGVLSPGVQVLGVGNLLTNLAKCCHPIPGDGIIGYITRNRGVTVHRSDCHNVVHEDEKERLVRVEWGKSVQQYPVGVQIDSKNRVGLLRDISATVA